MRRDGSCRAGLIERTGDEGNLASAPPPGGYAAPESLSVGYAMRSEI
jgi:hypothetical protein